MVSKTMSASERRAYLHTLHHNRIHVERRIVSLRRQIHELNDEHESALRQLDDIDRSINWLADA
jgi:chromosome segregation ATPase